MAFNIDQFKATGLNNGGVRPSLFQVVMTGVPSQEVGFTDKFTFTCKASTIPASTIQQIEIPYFGRQIKLAGDRTFAPWTVTVMNDEDFNSMMDSISASRGMIARFDLEEARQGTLKRVLN